MFVSVSPEPLNLSLIFLLITLILASTRKIFAYFVFIGRSFSFFDSSMCNSTELPSEFKILSGLNGPNISSKIDPYCTILDSLVFENFVLADEPFTKASRILETVSSYFSTIFYSWFWLIKLWIRQF